MKVQLSQGDVLTVALADTDGEVTLIYDAGGFRIETDWDDSSGRKGVIYNAESGITPDSATEWGGPLRWPLPVKFPLNDETWAAVVEVPEDPPQVIIEASDHFIAEYRDSEQWSDAILRFQGMIQWEYTDLDTEEGE